MKSTFNNLTGSLCIALAIFVSSPGFAQEKPGKTVGAQADAEYAKISPKERKGSFTRETDCVDLVVLKGCVTYSIAIPEDSKAAPEKIKVCHQPNLTDSKPVQICKKGAKKITVNYEKEDDSAMIEFTPTKRKVVKANQKPMDVKQN